LRITQGKQTKHYYVDGGFVQIRANVVTVLTAKAIAATDIKVGEAQAALQSAAPAVTAEAQEARQKAQQRARARSVSRSRQVNDYSPLPPGEGPR